MDNQPPVNVPDVLARVTRVHTNIARHRKAMADVAAAAAAAAQAAQDAEVNAQ